MVQLVDEGPEIALHPDGFCVRRIGSYNTCAASLDPTRPVGYPMVGSVFPTLSGSEERFAPRVSVNSGRVSRKRPVLSPSRAAHHAALLQRHSHLYLGGEFVPMGPTGWDGVAGCAPAVPLRLFEYATVDFFIETACCPTEVDFLRLATCVDVQVSSVREEAGQGAGVGRPCFGKRVLAVTLSERGPAMGVLNDSGMCAEMWRPSKRRVAPA